MPGIVLNHPDSTRLTRQPRLQAAGRRKKTDWRGFNEALNDGVSALSSRGDAPALSTYWIDLRSTGPYGAR